MSKDTKMFVIMGIVFVALGGIMFWVHHLKSDPNRTLNPVVESMVRDLSTSKWSGQALMKYATPEFQKWMIDNNVANGMPGFSYLGKVKKYVGIRQLATNENMDFAKLISEFQFEAGTAYVILQLSKRNGQWLIYSFNVESPLFQNATPTLTTQ